MWGEENDNERSRPDHHESSYWSCGSNENVDTAGTDDNLKTCKSDDMLPSDEKQSEVVHF